MGNSLYALIALHDFHRAGVWVDHTQTTLIALADVRALIQRADITERNFRDTGEERFIASFRRAADRESVQLAKLQQLVTDNPAQQQRVDLIATLVREHLGKLEAILVHAPAVDGPSPSEILERQTTLEHLRDAIGDAEAEEQRLLRERMTEAASRANIAQSVQIASTIGTIVLIGFIVMLMRAETATSERKAQARSAELASTNATLRQSESELHSREQMLNGLIDATPAGVAIFDRNMRYIAASRRYREDFQLGDKPLTGRSHYEVFPEIPERWRAIHRRCLNGATANATEEPFHRADGRIDWLRWEIRPWHDATGAIGGVTLFSEVITARKLAEIALAETERQLRQAQKMEVVGQLTGGIAHDFNNMLGVIIGNIEFLCDAVAENPELSDLAHEILDTAMQGAEMNRRLLAFARKQPLRPQPIDLSVIIPDLAAMLARTLGESIRVQTRLAGETWLALADQAQVSEALLNLAVNARDAMPNGGSLVIEVGNVTLDASYIAENVEAQPGDYVVLSVTDTGGGMTPLVIERATEPFFTTKGVGHGTGLGLSMVHGFARQSGGYLKITSEVGLGTTVRLYLPRAAECAGLRGAIIAPAQRVPGGNESILLVDDNTPMRIVAQRHLTALGYQVDTAESGPAALRKLRSPAVYDLLFTDIVMPDGMNGYDLAEAARRIRPELRVLFTTGYAGGVVDDSGGDAAPGCPPAHVLRKPYERTELAVQVRAALDTEEVQPAPAA